MLATMTPLLLLLLLLRCRTMGAAVAAAAAQWRAADCGSNHSIQGRQRCTDGGRRPGRWQEEAQARGSAAGVGGHARRRMQLGQQTKTSHFSHLAFELKPIIGRLPPTSGLPCRRERDLRTVLVRCRSWPCVAADGSGTC